MLNLHVKESAEIELPGIIVRITDIFDKIVNETDDESLWDPGEMVVSIPGLGNAGMDVWTPFFGTLMAMTACCTFIAIATVLEKVFMCVGGEAIHNAVEEQQRVNTELHRIITVLEPILSASEKATQAQADAHVMIDGEEPKKKKITTDKNDIGENINYSSYLTGMQDICM